MKILEGTVSQLICQLSSPMDFPNCPCTQHVEKAVSSLVFGHGRPVYFYLLLWPQPGLPCATQLPREVLQIKGLKILKSFWQFHTFKRPLRQQRQHDSSHLHWLQATLGLYTFDPHKLCGGNMAFKAKLRSTLKFMK